MDDEELKAFMLTAGKETDELMEQITNLITSRRKGGAAIAGGIMACCTLLVVISGRIMPRGEIPDFLAKIISSVMEQVYQAEDDLKAKGELK